MASQESITSPITSPTAKRPHRKFSQRTHSGHLDAHHEALSKIRSFLRSRSAFDVFPLSYRFIIFDTKLTVKHALNTMHQNGTLIYPSPCLTVI
jgi:5'-AMP-activated protein kinase, regulatory gamma subunit